MTVRGGDTDAVSRPPVLQLLGTFSLLVQGVPVPLHHASARVFAAVALYRHPMPRPVLAEALWPFRGRDRARANLRSAVWRMERATQALLVDDGECVRLSPDVEVDADTVRVRCRQILLDESAERPPVASSFGHLALVDDLLPTWDDDWVLAERERLRQLRLHALEASARMLLAAGRVGEAVDAASVALASEPLRESAARALVAAHLSTGNVAAARGVFARHRADVRRELGVEPSAQLCALLDHDAAALTSP